jgi:PTH1 family peptidyl-tRNA hydrolase
MKLIAGLGNPGGKYRETRHNLGFRVIEELSSRHKIKLDKNKHQSLFGEGKIEKEGAVLVKPLTFVNLSGEALSSLKSSFLIEVEDIIVIHDDLDLERGSIRIRTKGSSGGHKGVNSIIEHLGTEEFIRIRIGIGRPSSLFDKTAYVLGEFAEEEKGIMGAAVREAAEAAGMIVREGAGKTMNKYNKKGGKE